MEDVKMPHSQHEKHLCFLHNTGHLNHSIEHYKGLVKEGKHVCKGCGRVAANEINLCDPEKL